MSFLIKLLTYLPTTWLPNNNGSGFVIFTNNTVDRGSSRTSERWLDHLNTDHSGNISKELAQASKPTHLSNESPTNDNA